MTNEENRQRALAEDRILSLEATLHAIEKKEIARDAQICTMELKVRSFGDEVRALETSQKAALLRHEKLGKACLKWAASIPEDRLVSAADLDLHAAIKEWAGL